MRSLALLLIAFCTCTSAFAQKMDASDLNEALVMVALASAATEEFRKSCGRNLPKSKRNFDGASLRWRSRNSDEIDALTTFQATPEAQEFQQAMSTAGPQTIEMLYRMAEKAGWEVFCANRLDGWSSGRLDIANETPKASALLKDFLRSHPLPADRVEWQDSMMGCLKQRFNQSIDLDSSIPVCECVAKVITEGYTPAQRAEVDRRARAGTSLADYGPAQRVAPKIRACTGG